MNFDLSDIEIIDFHMHHFNKMTITQRAKTSAVAYLDRYSLVDEVKKNTWISTRTTDDLDSPYWQSLVFYISRTYGCKPELEEVDKHLQNTYAGNFTEYIKRMMDRENISLIQCASTTPEPLELPKERMKWVLWSDDLINLAWLGEKNGFRSLDDVVENVRNSIQSVKRQGCLGLKNTLGYTRSLDIEMVSETAASDSFKELKPKTPFRLTTLGQFRHPMLVDTESIKNFKKVQDFLLKQILIQCGELGLSYHFHTGGGLAPTDIRNCNPLLMYPLFFDSEILEAGTRIVLLHTSVPFFAEAAIAATSFPHVYVDLSWPVRTPIMRQVLRHVLTQVSSRKILYGSDAWELADQLGMAASTFRKHFGAALDELRQEGWSEDYCLKTAKRVMHENATELMKLPLST